MYIVYFVCCVLIFYFFFFFNYTATTEIYTLSLHDALPIRDDVPDDTGDDRCHQGLRGEPCRSEEHTSELQSRRDLVCRLLLEKKKTQNRELPPDNDHHHPWRYKGMSARIMHSHQRNEGRRNQQLVRNRIQQNSQGRHLPVSPREISIGPIGGCRGQQDQHAPDLKVHGKAPQHDVGAPRQQHHNQHWNEEDPQDGKGIRQVHSRACRKAAFRAFRTHIGNYRLRPRMRQRGANSHASGDGQYLAITNSFRRALDIQILIRNTVAANLCKRAFRKSCRLRSLNSAKPLRRTYKPCIYIVLWE